MTRKQFEKKFDILLENEEINKSAKKIFRKIEMSGAIDIEREPENSYRLAKLLLFTALEEISTKYAPINEADVEELNNIKKFV